jgi:choice-of-anchor B domain-containing protein
MRRLTGLVLASILVFAPAPPASAAYGDITLVGYLPLSTFTRITNVWGYYDYDTGKEYALVGDWTGGFYIIDVSDPANPVEVRKVTSVPGFDLKPFGHYVYSCDGNSSGKDSRITDISNPAIPLVLPGKFNSCHTITISTRGHLYAAFPGVTVYDIATHPGKPDSLFHVANQGHDTTWRKDRLYDFNGGALNIWDVTDPAQPVYVGGNDDPSVGYYHSGDESKDRSVLYVCDEYAVTPAADIILYDITNPALPARIGDINDPTARVHQLYVVGDLMFAGYYTAGFKVFDISNPSSPVLADAWDTSVYQTETGPDVYSGAYNAYPFSPSGIVYVSDHPSGLYLFSVEGHTGAVTGVRDRSRDAARLEQNFPNPFNPSTSIPFELRTAGHARLRVYNVQGALVRTLVDDPLPAGRHATTWDGTDDRRRPAASGVYYYRLDAGGDSSTRRMVLLK